MIEQWMKPMLCSGKTDGLGRFTSDSWAAEAKFDGWRAIVHRREDGLAMFNGRNGSEYSGHLPYIEAALWSVLPADSCIDGELISPLGHGGVQSAMFTHEVHRPTPTLPALSLVVFDVLRLDGQDTRGLPWDSRRRLVELMRLGGAYVKRSVTLPLDGGLELALNTGFEGMVLKKRDSRYVNGRSSSWIKLKPQQTIEAKVVGFKEGENSFTGLVGALEFELLDSGVRSRCSGFDMKLRYQITANREDWLGAVIEVKHHGLSKDGVPRHPQFLRRRHDREVAA